MDGRSIGDGLVATFWVILGIGVVIGFGLVGLGWLIWWLVHHLKFV